MKKIILAMTMLLTLVVTACNGQGNKQVKKENMKTLVVYFSQTGNTEKIAKKAAEATGADIELLETITPHTGNYQKIVSDAQDEVERDFQRPIKPLKHNVKDYDNIINEMMRFWTPDSI
jgi:hypothetical protein